MQAVLLGVFVILAAGFMLLVRRVHLREGRPRKARHAFIGAVLLAIGGSIIIVGGLQ
ncbi:MAG: hypothetical protein H0Z39_02810 [Peptococcaceae bacterium]|nr:hypothetical protein [Peptococcaceae bacterium]